MENSISFAHHIFNYGILVYSLSLVLAYIILAYLSGRETNYHIKKNSFVDYRTTLASPFAPMVSIIAPAYNEGKTIVDNIKSLLALHYTNFEVIIVNDGSKDDSMQKCIEMFELELVNFAYNEQISTQPIKGIYKSRNKIHAKLTVVDKENGGKADAINVGINIAKGRIFGCVDVDCILEQDAILRIVKPFIEERECKIIAAGASINVVNSCEIVDGHITKVQLPKGFLPRVQVLEYFRSFLLGRMAWSRLQGLMIVSGAFGFFDREIAVKVGGYNKKTVGEDMEMVVRMRRYMEENNLRPYRVAYIPEPLCWTEVPITNKILSRQRNRWTRGTAETLWLHRKLLFNPRYRVLGMLSAPFWFLYEWLAPVIEFIGTIYFLGSIITGNTNWPFFLSLLGLVYTFAITLSVFSILSEDVAAHRYRDNNEVFKILLTALVEPIIFHPRLVWWAIKGNYDLIIGTNKGWGEMTRAGFSEATTEGSKKPVPHSV